MAVPATNPRMIANKILMIFSLCSILRSQAHRSFLIAGVDTKQAVGRTEAHHRRNQGNRRNGEDDYPHRGFERRHQDSNQQQHNSDHDAPDAINTTDVAFHDCLQSGRGLPGPGFQLSWSIPQLQFSLPSRLSYWGNYLGACRT